MMMLIVGVYIFFWFLFFFIKGEVKLVEFVVGMGVFLRVDKVFYVMDKLKEFLIRFFRILMDMFFELEIMVRSIVKGS